MKAYILKISICLIGLIVGLSSCGNYHLEKETFLEKKGGEDTDTPIMVGLGINAQEDPLYPALVELYKVNEVPIIADTATDQNGNFQFRVDTGFYYVKLFQNEQLLITSDTVEVVDSTYFVVQL
ncbi:MAG: hypothetical protein ACPF9D_08235 [Owenweeksia sp.]